MTPGGNLNMEPKSTTTGTVPKKPDIFEFGTIPLKYSTIPLICTVHHK